MRTGDSNARKSWEKITVLTLMVVLSLVLVFSVHSTAEARSNKDDIQREIENGWTVAWGEEIDHWEYAKLIATIAEAYITDNPWLLYEYFKDLLYDMIEALGTDVVLRAIEHRGSLFAEGELEVQGGIATYDHWHEESWGTMNEPNTHQPYVRWRQAAGLPPEESFPAEEPSASTDSPDPVEPVSLPEEITARKQAVLLLFNQYLQQGF